MNISKEEKKIDDTKKYIGFNVSEETKDFWQNFANENKISTISKLIRQSVDFYIKMKPKMDFLENIDKITHGFKEPLTAIKGYSQLLIEDYKDELDWDILLKIKNIFDESLKLEKKISDAIEQISTEDIIFDVLIIDDDDSTINLLKDYFDTKGYSTKEVAKGKEALILLKKNVPKLIMLDVLLPDINGYEVCNKIRSELNLKDIPIFYITAVPEGEVREKIKETGANGYFIKPFDLKNFTKLKSYL
ncbi:MAG: response regulator [Promethearchaeota archaeon]